MSDKRTWERRVLAGLIDVIDEDGVELIEGLTIVEQPEGGEETTVFVHETLTQTEAERVGAAMESIRSRLMKLYDQRGDASGQDSATDDDEPEEGAESAQAAEAVAAALAPDADPVEDLPDPAALAASAQSFPAPEPEVSRDEDGFAAPGLPQADSGRAAVLED